MLIRYVNAYNKQNPGGDMHLNRNNKKINVRYKYFLAQAICTAYFALFFWLANSDDIANVVLGSYFCVVVLVAMLFRDQIVIVDDGELIYRFRGVLFFGFKKEFSLKVVKKVSLVETTICSRGDSRLGYAVQLVSNKKDELYVHQNLLHTRAVAEKVTAAIKKNMENRVFGYVNERTYSNLDQPLLSYASLTKEVSKVNDRISLRVTDTVNKRKVVFSQNSRGDKEILYWTLACLIFLSLAFSPLAVLLIVVGPFIVFSLLLFHGSSKIFISNSKIRIRQGLNPFTKVIRINDLEEITIGKGVLYFWGDKKVLNVRGDGGYADLKQIKMLIIEKLMQFKSDSVKLSEN